MDSRYTRENAWREDHRRADIGKQVNMVATVTIATLAIAAAMSVDWCGHWQRTGFGS